MPKAFFFSFGPCTARFLNFFREENEKMGGASPSPPGPGGLSSRTRGAKNSRPRSVGGRTPVPRLRRETLHPRPA